MPKQDKTFVRTGAGEVWIDDSLKDWPENDYRIFVGDLGKETTTEMLAKIFQVYKSFAKAKVELVYFVSLILLSFDVIVFVLSGETVGNNCSFFCFSSRHPFCPTLTSYCT